MANTLEQFILVTKMLGTDQAVTKLKSLTTAVEEVNKKTGMMTRTTTTLNATNKGLERTISQKTIPATRRFSFEFLGLMFAGMALQKMFQGLIQPAFTTAGIFELISSILEITFLPVAIMLIEPLAALLGFFADMPDIVKLAIGIFALLGLAFGAALMIIGQLALGVVAFTAVLASPIVASAIAGISGALAGLIAFIGPILLPLLAILAVAFFFLAGAFQENGDAIMKALTGVWEGFMSIFGGIIDILDGFITFFVGVFTLDADMAFDGLVKIFSGGAKIIEGVFIKLIPAIIDLFIQLSIGIGKFALKIPGFFFSLFAKIIGAIPGFVGAIISALAGVGGSIVDSVFGGLGAIGGIIGLAGGGIVTQPTLAVVGEAGPEAVIPLSGRGGGGGLGGGTIFANFEINARIENDVDVRNLAKQINDELVNEQRRRGFIT